MITVSDGMRDAVLAARLAYLDTGAGRCRCRIYATARPAGGGDPGGAELVEIELDDPAGTVSAGAAVLTASDAGMATASGIAVWARFVTGDDTFAFDCDVKVTAIQAAAYGIPERAGEIELSSLQLNAGGLVELVSAVIG